MAKKETEKIKIIKEAIHELDDEILIIQIALKAIQKLKEKRNNKEDKRCLEGLEKKLKNI